MKPYLTLIAALLLVLPALAASGAGAEGFVPLFNGKDLSGWKLRNAGGHASWSVKDGELVNDVSGGKHGTDLVTEKAYKNFIVRCEYNIPKGANSGVYLRGRHEIQIADDYERGKPSKGGNGAIYNQASVASFVSKKPGEWQTLEASIVGDKITVTLNGVKVHDQFVSSQATGGQLDDKVGEPGPIMLQGDHGSIRFRNLSIKPLP